MKQKFCCKVMIQLYMKCVDLKKKILNTLYLFSGNQNYNKLHCISKSIRDNKMADLRLSSAEICPCCITESEFPSGIGVYMTQNAIQ